MSGNDEIPVQSLRKSVEIIETIQKLDRAGATKLSSELGLKKTTVHSHLKSLEACEYLVCESGEYQVGLRFLEHGGRILSGNKLYNVGEKECKNLADTVGERVNLVVEEHGYGVYLLIEEGERAVADDAYIGKRTSLHTSAAGKAILAHLAEDEVANIVEQRGLPEKTANTVTSHNALKEELTTVRKRGYALDLEENVIGLRCIAVPILVDETVIGAISISGPTSRMNEKHLHKLNEDITEAANIIQVNYSYA